MKIPLYWWTPKDYGELPFYATCINVKSNSFMYNFRIHRSDRKKQVLKIPTPIIFPIDYEYTPEYTFIRVLLNSLGIVVEFDFDKTFEEQVSKKTSLNLKAFENHLGKQYRSTSKNLLVGDPIFLFCRRANIKYEDHKVMIYRNKTFGKSWSWKTRYKSSRFGLNMVQNTLFPTEELAADHAATVLSEFGLELVDH